MDNQELEQSVNIAEYYYIILKHKWLIMFCLVIVGSLTAFFTIRMTPIYSAAATMVIENQRSKSPLTGEAIDYGSYVSQTLSFNTHLKLIASRPVLERVIRMHKLDRSNIDKGEQPQISFPMNIISHIKKNVSLFLVGEEKPPTPPDRQAALIEGLRRKINVSEVRDTLLLKINVEDQNPVMARDIANSLAQAYIEFNTASKLRSSRSTLIWMTSQLYETQKKLEDAEAEFLAYKQKEQLFSIQGRQDLITQKIQEFNDAYLDARNKRLELDAKLSNLRGTLQSRGELTRVRSLIDNPLIDTLYSRLHEAEVEYNRLSSVFRSMHPKIVQIRSKIDETRRKLDEELSKEMENLKAERSVLHSKERILQRTISGFENDALETGKKEIAYTILQRKVNTNQKLHDLLLGKIEESNIEESLDVSNIRIAEEAVIPVAPVKPDKKRNILLGALVGLMIGVGLSFLTEYMDRTLRTEEDVRKHLGLPVLSVIPEAELP